MVNITGKGGFVEKVSLRTTVLRGIAGNIHYVPNDHIDVVTNMTKEYSRYVFDIGIAYREDVEVMEGIKTSTKICGTITNSKMTSWNPGAHRDTRPRPVRKLIGCHKGQNHHATHKTVTGGPRVQPPPEKTVRRIEHRDTLPARYVVHGKEQIGKGKSPSDRQGRWRKRRTRLSSGARRRR